MYSCEKLAKGRKSKFDSDDRNVHHHCPSSRIGEVVSERNKYEFNFADTRKYHVQIALYEDRPRGLTYRLRRK